MDFRFDPAYLQLLDTNRELREELGKEVDINQENEKKIRILIKEVESCYRTISFQDNTILAHESEIQDLKTQVSNLEKRLRIALKDTEKKESFISSQEIQISDLESEVVKLKIRIHKIYSQEYNSNSAEYSTDMTHQGDTIPFHVNRIIGEGNNIRVYIQNPQISNLGQNDVVNKVGMILRSANRIQTLAQNPNPQDAQNIAQLTIRAVTAENEVARLQSALNASEGDHRIMVLAYHNEKNERRRWFYSYKDKHRRVGELLREKLIYRKLLQINRDERKVLKFKVDSLERAKNKQSLQKNLSEWEYKMREKKGLTIQVPMPRTPQMSDSYISDSDSHTGGMSNLFDNIHRTGSRIGEYLDDIDEEIHDLVSDNDEEIHDSISDNGDDNDDDNEDDDDDDNEDNVPPLSSGPESSGSSSENDDIHSRCRRLYLEQNRLRRKAERDLKEYKDEHGLDGYWRERNFDRYVKWKNEAKGGRDIINNLNQNILNLQNININQPPLISTMPLGYGPPTCDGTGDPEDFINELRRFTSASRINIAPGVAQAPGRAELDGLFESCLLGDIKIWYENEVKNRNWMLDNVLDNTGLADLTAFRAINNATLIGINANQFLNEALNRHGQAGATGASIIPIGTWDEDWSIAGGHPAPIGTPVVAPNANTGNPIVAQGITIGQKIYLIKNESPPVVVQKNMAVFGQIMQGNKSIPQFSADIRKYGKLARMTPAQQHEQWRRGLNPFNQYNIRQGGLFFKPWDEQIKDLTELEAFTMSIQPGQNIYQPQNPYSYQAPVQQPPVQPSYQTPVQAPVQSQVIQPPKANTRPRRPKAVGTVSFSVDADGNPIAPVKQKKTPAPIPQSTIEEIQSKRLLQELYALGYRDEPIVEFIDYFNKRGSSRKNPNTNLPKNAPVKPPLPRKPRSKTKAQMEQELEETRKKLEEFHLSTPQSIPSVHNAYLEPPNSEDEEYESDDVDYETEEEENEELNVHNAEMMADLYDDDEKKNL